MPDATHFLHDQYITFSHQEGGTECQLCEPSIPWKSFLPYSVKLQAKKCNIIALTVLLPYFRKIVFISLS